MRTRVIDERVRLSPCVFDHWTPSNNHDIVAYPISGGGLIGPISTMTDVVTKNLRAHIEAGDIVNNPMHLVKMVVNNSNGSFTFTHPLYGTGVTSGDIGSLVYSAFGSDWFNISQDVERAGQIALVKAYAKVNQSSVMGGELLATFKQTHEMLKRPFKSAGELLYRTMFKRRKYQLTAGRYFGNVARANSQAWLEARYGMIPIILDGNTIIREFNKVYQKLMVDRRVARSGQTVSRSETRSFTDKTLPTTSTVATGTVILEQNARVNAGVIYEVTHQDLPGQFASILGFRKRDIDPVIWELMPWSFVVDWFTNIGDWIEATRPAPEIVVKDNWVTFVRGYRRYQPSGQLKLTGFVPGNPTYSAYGVYPSYEHFTVDVERRTNQSLASYPVLTGKSLSTLHTVDALALSCGKIIATLKELRH